MERGGLALHVADLLIELQALLVEVEGAVQVAAGYVMLRHLVRPGRFAFPEQIDFVRIPGMIKKTNEEYRPLSIKINPRHALDIRKNIITATAKTFQPHMFIVDKEPLGLKKEVLPTLRWIRRCLLHARHPLCTSADYSGGSGGFKRGREDRC